MEGSHYLLKHQAHGIVRGRIQYLMLRANLAHPLNSAYCTREYWKCRHWEWHKSEATSGRLGSPELQGFPLKLASLPRPQVPVQFLWVQVLVDTLSVRSQSPKRGLLRSIMAFPCPLWQGMLAPYCFADPPAQMWRTAVVSHLALCMVAHCARTAELALLLQQETSDNSQCIPGMT